MKKLSLLVLICIIFSCANKENIEYWEQYYIDNKTDLNEVIRLTNLMDSLINIDSNFTYSLSFDPRSSEYCHYSLLKNNAIIGSVDIDKKIEDIFNKPLKKLIERQDD